jgi:hypothetical protein
MSCGSSGRQWAAAGDSDSSCSQDSKEVAWRLGLNKKTWWMGGAGEDYAYMCHSPPLGGITTEHLPFDAVFR